MIKRNLVLILVGAASAGAVEITSLPVPKLTAPLTSSPSEVSQVLSEIYKVESDQILGLEETEPSMETKEETEIIPELFAEDILESDMISSELVPDDLNLDQELFLSVGKSEELEAASEVSSEETEDPRDPFISLETSPL